MLVSYLTQQQEYNDMKVDLEYYDEQLETILKNNKKFIDDTGKGSLLLGLLFSLLLNFSGPGF